MRPVFLCCSCRSPTAPLDSPSPLFSSRGGWWHPHPLCAFSALRGGSFFACCRRGWRCDVVNASVLLLSMHDSTHRSVRACVLGGLVCRALGFLNLERLACFPDPDLTAVLITKPCHAACIFGRRRPHPPADRCARVCRMHAFSTLSYASTYPRTERTCVPPAPVSVIDRVSVLCCSFVLRCWAGRFVLCAGVPQVRRDVLMARAWREGDFATAGELCAGKSERHIVAEQLQIVR